MVLHNVLNLNQQPFVLEESHGPQVLRCLKVSCVLKILMHEEYRLAPGPTERVYCIRGSSLEVERRVPNRL